MVKRALKICEVAYFVNKVQPWNSGLQNSENLQSSKQTRNSGLQNSENLQNSKQTRPIRPKWLFILN